MFLCGVGFVGRVIKENLSLRGVLAVLGISIGLFCMVTVRCAVDSISKNIMEGFGSTSQQLLYLSKIPFSEPPGDEQYQWWEYLARKEITIAEYSFLRKSLDPQLDLLYMKSSSLDISTNNNSVENAPLLLLESFSSELLNLSIKYGREIYQKEFEKGVPVCMLSDRIAKDLFGEANRAVGKKIDLGGISMEVVGVTQSGRATAIPLPGMNPQVMIPVNASYSLVGNVDGGMILTAPKETLSQEELIGKIRFLLRSFRRLTPSDKDDFSINQISYLHRAMESLFSRIELVGNMIGGVSLAIGVFGIVNIMFVSVYQRRFVIGLKKAIGAGERIILGEFIIESLVLSLCGAVLAIVAVVFTIVIVNRMQEIFHLYLSLENILYGFMISIVAGIMAGSVPAWKAAKTDPVKVMRQN